MKTKTTVLLRTSDFELRTIKISCDRKQKIKTEMKKESENSVSKNTEILVVEDSITQATQIKHLLESHHYKVIVAHDGAEAIRKLSKHKPSLVISVPAGIRCSLSLIDSKTPIVFSLTYLASTNRIRLRVIFR